MASDEDEIRAVIDRWHRATAAADLPTILGLMTDDVIFLTPGKPPMNKAAFAAGFKGFAGRLRLESQQEIKEVQVAGGLATCWTHIALVTTDVESGERNQRAGFTLSVFRKEPGRGWQLARDANLMVQGSPV